MFVYGCLKDTIIEQFCAVCVIVLTSSILFVSLVCLLSFIFFSLSEYRFLINLSRVEQQQQ